MAKRSPGSSARTRFARRVRAARELLGWSQERLAEVSGLHRNYVGSVERGERNISIDNMERVAIALNVSLESLVTSSEC